MRCPKCDTPLVWQFRALVCPRVKHEWRDREGDIRKKLCGYRLSLSRWFTHEDAVLKIDCGENWWDQELQPFTVYLMLRGEFTFPPEWPSPPPFVILRTPRLMDQGDYAELDLIDHGDQVTPDLTHER